MTKTYVSLPDAAEAGLRGFVEEVDDRLSGDEDNYAVVEDVLVDLNGDREAYERWQNDEPVSAAERARLQSYDPHNVTFESEYYADKDDDAFREAKPLLWLWTGFDRTAPADSVDFGMRFREMLAGHLFEEAGENLRIFKGVTFTYGYNVSVGDNVVVHDDVHLDDRGKLTIGDRASISHEAELYTHDHDVVDQTDVTNYRTVVEDDARVTAGVVLRGGVRVGENALVGAQAVVQGDVPAHHIAVGMPARSVKVKPGWESVAEPLEDANVSRRRERIIEDDFPDDLDVFDEFGRDLNPPDA